MARAADLRELEEACPWLEDDFQADLALLADGTSNAARLYAADARVIARLAARVPRCAGDEFGATPWTSFRRDVALARKVSDRAAAAQIRVALRLTTVMPRTMGLLEAGVLTVPRAIAFVTELEAHPDELAAAVDTELADTVVLLPSWRIVQEVRRAVLRLDPDAAAQRAAAKNAGRGITLLPDVDDQATACLTGPAVPLQRWYDTVDAQARALKQAGDPRTLDALRFDLATSTYPCEVHSPADPTIETTADPAGATAEPSVEPTRGPSAGAGADEDLAAHAPSPAPAADRGDAATPGASATPAVVVPQVGTAAPDAAPDAAAGLRASGVEPASTDCRRGRPVQAMVVVPVETALGLSNEPAWLEGYGWISAPTCRQLLVDAELRRVCAQSGTGLLVDLADRDVRPPPTPAGVREALLSMVLDDVELNDVGWRTEPQHDPSDRLRDYVELRDRFCDGPTGARVPARRAELDHDEPWPEGPTAAWNLVARSQRTHHLKHHGWTPLRTATSTLWFSPAGQLAETPRHTSAPPGIDSDPVHEPRLPDPDELAHVDRQQLTTPYDSPPWLPGGRRSSTDWTWLDKDAPAPF